MPDVLVMIPVIISPPFISTSFTPFTPDTVMATPIPSSLKSLDISRFAHRAAQLEVAKPAVAFWCNYWIVNQILSKGLHNSDEESKAYTVNLVDRLELLKVENSANPEFTDDNAGQACVERFAQEIFQKGDNAMRANKASRQTADTFQAAATFLDLLNIWGSSQTDAIAKSKYAKYHALRIAKAIKAGDDPNQTNPPIEHSLINEAGDSPGPNDLGLQPIGTPSAQGPFELMPRPVTIEDVPDEYMELRAPPVSPPNEYSYSQSPGIAQDHSPHTLNLVPTPPNGLKTEAPFDHTAATGSDVSPLEPSPNELSGQDKTSYFPTALDNQSLSNYSMSQDIIHKDSSFYKSSGPPQNPHPKPYVLEVQLTNPPTTSNQTPSFSDRTIGQSQIPNQGSSGQPITTYHTIPTSPPDPRLMKGDENYITSEESIMKAQKHAKWAISALNFDDVSTAVKELKGALETLGAC
ncbi:MAG: hypothetical protein M1829_001091 [Trizodia sp. TS-e1964]|nr:MAG: hypothetical protein M1829_001091 [Trizodia sp. TS-e1964]